MQAIRNLAGEQGIRQDGIGTVQGCDDPGFHGKGQRTSLSPDIQRKTRRARPGWGSAEGIGQAVGTRCEIPCRQGRRQPRHPGRGDCLSAVRAAVSTRVGDLQDTRCGNSCNQGFTGRNSGTIQSTDSAPATVCPPNGFRRSPKIDFQAKRTDVEDHQSGRRILYRVPLGGGQPGQQDPFGIALDIQDCGGIRYNTPDYRLCRYGLPNGQGP